MDGKHENELIPADGTERPTRPDIRLYPVNEAAKVLGVSKAKVWRLIYAERLKTRWLDGRRLVPGWAIDEFVDSLPEEKPDLAEVGA